MVLLAESWNLLGSHLLVKYIYGYMIVVCSCPTSLKWWNNSLLFTKPGSSMSGPVHLTKGTIKHFDVNQAFTQTGPSFMNSVSFAVSLKLVWLVPVTNWNVLWAWRRTWSSARAFIWAGWLTGQWSCRRLRQFTWRFRRKRLVRRLFFCTGWEF